MSDRRGAPRHSSRDGREPFVIGLTGPIASGKSTVADMLRSHGAEVIDADRVYRSLLTPGSALAGSIAKRFGPGVVQPNGEIDRAALGRLVFADAAALADLDRLTHPSVVEAIRRQVAGTSAPVVVIEAVKLVQAGLTADIDALWYVTADPEVRLRRLMTRGNFTEESARARITAAPHSLPGNVRADVTIDNSGDLAATERSVDAAWSTFGVDSRVHNPASRESTARRGNP